VGVTVGYFFFLFNLAVSGIKGWTQHDITKGDKGRGVALEES